MILALAACAQTTATKTTSPRQEESRPPPPAAGEASSEPSGSGQQESQVDRQAHHPEPGRKAKSKSDKTASAETVSDPKTEAGSATPAESEPQQPKPQPSTGRVAESGSAEDKLAQAREDLRISKETEKRIAAELEQLKESGSASEEAVRDYQTYLESVAAMTAEKRKIVKQMETAYTEKSSGNIGSSKLDKMADPDIPEEQTIDEVAALDRQLNASLAKFDGMLLEEMEEIRAGSSEKLQNLAEEAADAAKQLRERGLDVKTSGSRSSAGGQERQQDNQAKGGDGKSTAADRKGSKTASRDVSGKGGEGPSSTDQRRRDYGDDDIVARQLREAAENETDPELKEKLWKEYDEYKKSK